MEFELTEREVGDALERYVRARESIPQEATVRRYISKKPRPGPAARVVFEMPPEEASEVARRLKPR